MNRFLRMCVLLGALALLSPTLAPAGRLPPLYTNAEQQESRRVYGDNLRGVWSQDLLGQLSGSEYGMAREIRMEIPSEGRDGNPFDFYSQSSTNLVVVPILSIRFFDDLAIAFASLERRGCSAAAALDYVGMLRYRRDRLMIGNRLRPPLDALGIDRNAAIADAWINQAAGNALKSAIYFIMAHELGHVLKQHHRTRETPMDQAQREEIEADDFAVKIMQRIAVPPLGMVQWFAAAARLEPAPKDFPSISAYERSVALRSHPLTAHRLTTLAQTIRDNAGRFSALQSDPVVWRARIVELARQIAETGANLDDRDMREFFRRRSLTMSLADLRAACP